MRRIAATAALLATLAPAGTALAQRAPWQLAAEPAVAPTFVIPIARAYDEASPPVPADGRPLLGLIATYDDRGLSDDGATLLPVVFIPRGASDGRDAFGGGGLLALFTSYDGDATTTRLDRLASGLPVARDYDGGPPLIVLPELTIESVDPDAAPHVLLPAVRVTP